MKVSICISTYGHARLLAKTLQSIYAQKPKVAYEVIVADDGSANAEEVKLVCDPYRSLKLIRIDRKPGYRNPSVARNVAYRAAQGEVIIAQSDDVIHHSPECIQSLVDTLKPGPFVVATVINVDEHRNPYRDPAGKGYGDKLTFYTGIDNQRPLFFLGALYRTDLYTVGGNDEEFTEPSGEDRWFGLCLTMGNGLRPIYAGHIVGHHQRHLHTLDYAAVARSQALLQFKIGLATRKKIPWKSSTGSWAFKDYQPSSP